jgi:hypothetical protein
MLMVSVSLMFAQMSPRSASDGNNNFTGSRDAIFECAPGYVFSQFDLTFDDAYYCDVNYPWTKVMDDYTATGPFSTIRFWGFNLSGCVPGASQTFLIEIYNGDPSSGGTLVNSFTKTATPQPKGVYVNWGATTEMYQVDIDLGTMVTQLNGWVSISRTSSTDGCVFAWTAMDYAGNGMSWGPGYGYYNSGAALYFCLGGGGGVVPISSWALIIGIALIATFAVVRMRKI